VVELSGFPHEKYCARGRLVDAAPELLAVLKRCIDELRSAMRQNLIVDGRLVKHAHALVEKIEGNR
jgi:hypothetical protein